MYRHVCCVLAMAIFGCGGDDSSDGPLGGSLTVTGEVVDFQGGAAVDTSVSVTASGITPAPVISSQGSTFTITEIPENSIFQILASAPPTYRATFSQVVEVTSSDVSGVKAPVVKETYLASLASAFAVTPTAARGVLIVRLTDTAGAPKSGVAASNVVMTGGPDLEGPFFLDANGMPAPGATTSSASGLVVFFEAAPGVVSAGIAANATATLDMATSPVAAGSVTLAVAKVIDGMGPMLPTNVSFANTVFPIFSGRGCVACHSGGGAGRDLGGLTLDGSANLVYKELTVESTTRVKVATPEASTILTKPLREEPPNHQTATFANPQDPDYLKILVWIKEGAKDN
ncbi:MAG: hypothetical protein H0T89_36040 [Deltaproteobacteria bacterium]|nr:hypothetical protein [Deltaproteobacteria bacterium]MDQ3299158.1 hypothetical protein [Myxococcota bacterium]